MIPLGQATSIANARRSGQPQSITRLKSPPPRSSETNCSCGRIAGDMHFRRFACLLLGAWLAGILVMAMIATQNFRTVDRILLEPLPAPRRN